VIHSFIPNSFLFLGVTVPLHLHITPLSLPLLALMRRDGALLPTCPTSGREVRGGLRRLCNRSRKKTKKRAHKYHIKHHNVLR